MSTSSPVRFAVISTAVVLAFCFLAKIPTWRYPISNWDELIYWQLTQHWMQTGHYSLQGTELLPKLPQLYYDHPAFHHPPGFCVLLMPFVQAQAPHPAILLSWLGHGLVIIALAIVGFQVLLRDAVLTFRSRALFLLPLLAAACDPLFNFISRKVWVDNLLAGECAMAFACAWLALKTPRWAWAAGLFAAAAISLKIATLIILPVLVLVVWRHKRLIWPIVLPPLLVFALWTLWFHHLTGAWMPWWMRPDEALLKTNAFVAASVHQPKFYYLSQLLLCCPFALVMLASLIFHRRIFSDPLSRLTLLWIAIYVGTFMVLGWLGMPSESRYIAPALPAVFLLFYARCANPSLERGNDAFFLLFSLAAVAGAMLSGFYLLVPQYDEILSPLRLFFPTGS